MTAPLTAPGRRGGIPAEVPHLVNMVEHQYVRSGLKRRPGPLVFAGDVATAAVNSRLVRDIADAGGRGALAGEDVEPGVYRLPRVPASVRPIVEILPVEMMTLALASIAGREAGKFERATKVTTTE